MNTYNVSILSPAYQIRLRHVDPVQGAKQVANSWLVEAPPEAMVEPSLLFSVVEEDGVSVGRVLSVPANWLQIGEVLGIIANFFGEGPEDEQSAP